LCILSLSLSLSVSLSLADVVVVVVPVVVIVRVVLWSCLLPFAVYCPTYCPSVVRQ
jgi:hypothetical protein